jgi:hypothetical protein
MNAKKDSDQQFQAQIRQKIPKLGVLKKTPMTTKVR